MAGHFKESGDPYFSKDAEVYASFAGVDPADKEYEEKRKLRKGNSIHEQVYLNQSESPFAMALAYTIANN